MRTMTDLQYKHKMVRLHDALALYYLVVALDQFISTLSTIVTVDSCDAPHPKTERCCDAESRVNKF